MLGGYMIACTSSPGRLYAAPFAIVGSIGVIGQTINIQRTLEKWGIRPLVFKSGEYKAPIGLLGDITKDDMKHVQSMIDMTHEAFQHHVIQHRPILTDTIDIIGNGNIWLGYHAYDYQLIDRIITSDEYIHERIYRDHARVLKLVSVTKSKYPFWTKPSIATTTSSSLTTSINQLMTGSSSLSQYYDHRHYVDPSSSSLLLPNASLLTDRNRNINPLWYSMLLSSWKRIIQEATYQFPLLLLL
jgi:ClpP class serine protease